MKTKPVLFLIALLLVTLAIAGCSTPAPAPAPKPTLPAQRTGSKVVAQAEVVPVQSAALSFASGGMITEVLVKEGEKVDAGKVLVRLKSDQQTAAVTVAQANVKKAQARVDELKAGPRPEEIAQSEAAVTIAQANLVKAQQPTSESQLISARADLANAKAALDQAQAAYDRAGGASNPYAGMLPTSLALQQSTNAYIAAQARLDQLQKGPTAADLAPLEAQVKQAQAALDVLKAGTRPETIATAQADVDSAKAALQQAQVALSDTELKAPIAGVITNLDAKVGEPATPGTVLVRVADLSTLQVQTTDLTELKVVSVNEGDAVTLTFDAIPDLQLPGKVSRIRQLGENRQGDIVYTVYVAPDKVDPRLRWKMTAQVSIEPKQ